MTINIILYLKIKYKNLSLINFQTKKSERA